MYRNSITIQYMYRYWTHIAADLKPKYYLSGTYFSIFYVSHNKYKIFTQHSCCLAGRAYPLGDIPEEMEADVKKNVFQCITRMKNKAGQSARFPFLLSFLEFFFFIVMYHILFWDYSPWKFLKCYFNSTCRWFHLSISSNTATVWHQRIPKCASPSECGRTFFLKS